MNLLLDTCSFLWATEEPERLSKRAAAALEDPSTELFLSAASVWEVSLKYRLGRLKMSSLPKAFVPQAMEDLQLRPLPQHLEEAVLEASLPPYHKDPFDRMLVCQAMAHNLTILTSDPLIHLYEVPCLW